VPATRKADKDELNEKARTYYEINKEKRNERRRELYEQKKSLQQEENV
jgi:hypothetical protein